MEVFLEALVQFVFEGLVLSLFKALGGALKWLAQRALIPFGVDPDWGDDPRY